MTARRLICGGAFWFLLTPCLMFAAIIEVRPTNCSDSSCDPCCTISAAVLAARDGDRINVRSGTFVESVDIASMNGDLTIVAADGAGSVTVAPSSGSAFTTSIEHSWDITLGGFDASSSTTDAVHLTASGSVTLSDIFVITAPAGGGIYVESGDAATLTGCVANGSAGYGIFVYAFGAAQINGCTANGNAHGGIQVMGDNVAFQNTTASDNLGNGFSGFSNGYVAATGCTASSNGPGFMGPANGMELHSYWGTVSIHGSVSEQNEGHGVKIDLVDSKKRAGWLEVEGCRFLTNGGYGIMVASDAVKNADALLLGHEISCTDIGGNTTGGLSVGIWPTITAELCWWNHPTGPSGLGAGSGDAIDVIHPNYVDYEPWLTAPAAESPECALFKDGFESGDTSAWSASTKPTKAPTITPQRH